MAVIDKELETYYQNRFEMFGTPGWKELVEDVKAMLEATDKISTVKDANELFLKKGEVSIMNWLLSLEEMSRYAYKQLKENE